MKLTITVPDELGVHDPLLKVTKAVLEALEPGASTHCLGRTHDGRTYWHHRLGVFVTAET